MLNNCTITISYFDCKIDFIFFLNLISYAPFWVERLQTSQSYNQEILLKLVNLKPNNRNRSSIILKINTLCNLSIRYRSSMV